MFNDRNSKNLRTRQKVDTRNKILKATLKLIEKRGFAAVRTDEVAKASRISHGSVFAHFETRDDLLKNVASKYLGEIDATTRKALQEQIYLEEFLKAHLNAISEHELFFCRVLEDVHLLPKEVRALIVEINSAVSSHLKVVLARDPNATELKPTEYFFIFNVWMGTISYYLLNRDLFASSKSVLDDRGEEIIQLFLKMIQKRKKGENV